MGRQVIPVGDRLIINMPGGGGFGDPKERAHREISADLKLGLISQEVAEREYHYRKEED